MLGCTPQRLSTPSRTMPSFSKNSHRCGVVNVTNCPDSENPALAQRPIHERPCRFSRVSLAPFGSGQVISEADLVVLSCLFGTEEVTRSGRVDAYRHEAHEHCDLPCSRQSRRASPSLSIEFSRWVRNVWVSSTSLCGRQRQMSGHVVVARVTFINGRCIFHSRSTQAQTWGFKGVCWTKCG